MLQIHNTMVRPPGLAALTALIWFVAAAGLIFWVLKFPDAGGNPGSAVPPTPVASMGSAAPATAQTARAWGVQSVVPQASMASSIRFQLLGVIASASGRGSALISVDGQPPKAFRVGQTLADGVTLISLSAKQANLGPAVGGLGVFSLTLPGQDKAP